MQRKIRGIVLGITKHNDKNNIITLYTRELGRLALLSPVGSGKSGRMRNARIAPLAVIDTEINFRAGRDLQFLGTVSTPHPWRNIYFDPMRSAMSMFVAEFLLRLLRTSEADTPMWEFLVHSLDVLDRASKGLANFHLVFLAGLLEFAGIAPDVASWTPGAVFDLQEATFVAAKTLGPGPLKPTMLPAGESAFIPVLMRTGYRTMHLLRLNVQQRRRILVELLKYYSQHLPIKTDLTSLEVLRELF